MCFKRLVNIVGKRSFSSGIENKSIDLTVLKEGIALMTMQRPPVNALNIEMLEKMNTLFDEVSNENCRGLVITSAVPKIFSAGLDIKEIYKPDLKRAEAFWNTAQEFWLKLFGARYVTTAAINGHAFAAGCVISLSCEYRAMVQGNSTTGLNVTAIGLVASPFVVDLVCNVLPIRQAEFALTTGKMFTVDEALRHGLIDDIAKDKQDAINKCKEFIKKFDDIPPNVRSMTKQRFRDAPMRKLRDNRQKDIDEFLNMIQNPIIQENLKKHVHGTK